MGGGGEAWPRDVGNGGRGSGNGEGSDDTRGAQAADSHAIRQPRGSTLMARGIEKLRDQGTSELAAHAGELAEQVFRLRFQLSTGQAEAVTKLRVARKDLARVKTLLRERELRKTDGK